MQTFTRFTYTTGISGDLGTCVLYNRNILWYDIKKLAAELLY